MATPRKNRKSLTVVIMETKGWELAFTSPLTQSFRFERWLGKRRVAMVIVVARSTAKAWTMLKRVVEKDEKKRKVA